MNWGFRASTLLAEAAGRSGLLKAYGSLRDHLTGPAVRILAYHRVNPRYEFPSDVPLTSLEDFEEEIRYLTRKYRVIPLMELCRNLTNPDRIPSDAVVITFDDGYRDNYRYAYPILQKYGAPATIFLATGHIGSGTPFWWDRLGYAVHKTAQERLSLNGLGAYSLKTDRERTVALRTISAKLKRLPDDEKNLAIEELVRRAGLDAPLELGREIVLSWDEVREMARNGISFGAHTEHHPILTRLSPDEARREIVQSQRRIQEKLDVPVNTFAYPNGWPKDYNEEIKSVLKENRFICAVAYAPSRLVHQGTDPFDLGRISARSSLAMFHLSVSGVYPDVLTARRRLRGK